MKLLDAKTVAIEQNKKDAARIENIQKLRDEEVAAVARVNELHDLEKRELKTIDHRIATARDIEQNEIFEIGQTLAALYKEVSHLESRKEKALEPIYELEKEATQRLEYLAEKESAIESTRVLLEDSMEDLKERIETVIEREEESAEKNTKSDRRERAVVAEEQRLKESSNKLAQEWVKFHTDVSEVNIALEIRERDIQSNKKINEDFKLELDRKEKEQIQKDREIQDRYETLAKALDEAKKKHGVSLSWPT